MDAWGSGVLQGEGRSAAVSGLRGVACVSLGLWRLKKLLINRCGVHIEAGCDVRAQNVLGWWREVGWRLISSLRWFLACAGACLLTRVDSPPLHWGRLGRPQRMHADRPALHAVQP